MAGIVQLAGAGAIDGLAVITVGTILVALAWHAFWITKVPVITAVAFRGSVLLATFARARLFRAVSGQVEIVAIAGLTDIGGVQRPAPGSVELRLAAVTVDALRVVPAVSAHASALVVPVDIQRQMFLVDLWVVYALVRVTETVTRFTGELLGSSGLSPLLLLESLTAGCALRSTGVVLTPAEQLLRQLRIQDVASVRVAVAHAPTADADVFDRVEVSPGDSGVLPDQGHQVTQQVLRPEEPEADVGSPCPFLQES